MFISLNVEPETYDAAVEALDTLRAEFEGRGAQVRDGRWRYKLLVVEDLDGNQLFFQLRERPSAAEAVVGEIEPSFYPDGNGQATIAREAADDVCGDAAKRTLGVGSASRSRERSERWRRLALPDEAAAWKAGKCR
jgi:hypothetical protein